MSESAHPGATYGDAQVGALLAKFHHEVRHLGCVVARLKKGASKGAQARRIWREIKQVATPFGSIRTGSRYAGPKYCDKTDSKDTPQLSD